MAILPTRSIAAYLRLAAERGFDLRNYNCGHFISGWLKLAYGIETRPEFLVETNILQASLRRCNLSMVEYVDQMAGGLGFGRVYSLGLGDIVVREFAMGLAVPPYCAFIGRGGLCFLRCEPDGIWRRQSGC